MTIAWVEMKLNAFNLDKSQTRVFDALVRLMPGFHVRSSERDISGQLTNLDAIPTELEHSMVTAQWP
jgi:hypothetical protein